MKPHHTFLVCVWLLIAGCANDNHTHDRDHTHGRDHTHDTITFGAQTFLIAEDAKAGASVGMLRASVDKDGVEVTFAATEDDTGTFAVDSAGDITLRAGKTLDFEDATIPNGYAMNVTASAEGVDDDVTAQVTIIVDNALEITFKAQTFSIAKDASAGASVGTLKASVDKDGVEVTFAATEDDTGTFAVSSTGAVTLKAGAVLEFDDEDSAFNVYTVDVIASTEGADDVTATVTIIVNDVITIS